MNKESLLKSIAETGYNAGFGAKKHFATFDIVTKAPGWISFASMSFGIFGFVYKGLATETFAAAFIVLGIVSLYISFYDSKKHEYETAAVGLTQLFNKLKSLYRRVESANDEELTAHSEELLALESDYYNICISTQILFSDWYAHYKFFWQHQIDWVDEQKNFRFWRDKLPLSFTLPLLVLGIVGFLVCIDFISLVEALCQHLRGIV